MHGSGGPAPGDGGPLPGGDTRWRQWDSCHPRVKESAMNPADMVVVIAAAVAAAVLVRFFFGSRRTRAAEPSRGVQRVQVTVRGGYGPDVIRLRQGVPAGLVSHRQQSAECTDSAAAVLSRMPTGPSVPAASPCAPAARASSCRSAATAPRPARRRPTRTRRSSGNRSHSPASAGCSTSPAPTANHAAAEPADGARRGADRRAPAPDHPRRTESAGFELGTLPRRTAPSRPVPGRAVAHPDRRRPPPRRR